MVTTLAFVVFVSIVVAIGTIGALAQAIEQACKPAAEMCERVFEEIY